LITDSRPKIPGFPGIPALSRCWLACLYVGKLPPFLPFLSLDCHQHRVPNPSPPSWLPCHFPIVLFVGFHISLTGHCPTNRSMPRLLLESPLSAHFYGPRSFSYTFTFSQPVLFVGFYISLMQHVAQLTDRCPDYCSSARFYGPLARVAPSPLVPIECTPCHSMLT
jgi:hypothetical protein